MFINRDKIILFLFEWVCINKSKCSLIYGEYFNEERIEIYRKREMMNKVIIYYWAGDYLVEEYTNNDINQYNLTDLKEEDIIPKLKESLDKILY